MQALLVQIGEGTCICLAHTGAGQQALRPFQLMQQLTACRQSRQGCR